MKAPRECRFAAHDSEAVLPGEKAVLSVAQALLSNAFAWMRKSSEDSLDGMVALLQKARNMWQISSPRGQIAITKGLVPNALDDLLDWQHGKQLLVC
jgi:hypothetical protein